MVTEQVNDQSLSAKIIPCPLTTAHVNQSSRDKKRAQLDFLPALSADRPRHKILIRHVIPIASVAFFVAELTSPLPATWGPFLPLQVPRSPSLFETRLYIWAHCCCAFLFNGHWLIYFRKAIRVVHSHAG